MNEHIKDIKKWLKEQHLPKIQTKFSFKTCYIVLLDGASIADKSTALTTFTNEFAKQVYTIDLSKIVSKYVEDAQRKLDGIFSEVTAKDWILFFDEADSLFGKRTDVKDAHDKYATRKSTIYFKT